VITTGISIVMICLWCGLPVDDCPSRDEHEGWHRSSETTYWRQPRGGWDAQRVRTVAITVDESGARA
jgi:hypothetical protein